MFATARMRPKHAEFCVDYRWNEFRFIAFRQTNRGAVITDRFFSHATRVGVGSPPRRHLLGGARARRLYLQLSIGITTPGETNIRRSIWMKLYRRVSRKFLTCRSFIRT